MMTTAAENQVTTLPRAATACTQARLLRRFMQEAPFQPATNLWRAIELPVLAAALPPTGLGLDIGCGDGVLTAVLRGLTAGDWQLVGVDPDPAETTLARSSKLYQRVHTAPADCIPERDAAFDFAFANSVLEHIPCLPDCLAEIARCLKPGGLFVATVPSPHFHDCLKGPGWTRFVSRQDYVEEIDERLAHVHYWSEDRWQQQLDAAGFEPQPFSCYLSKRQVRRWEFWSNWTGGLLYRLSGKTEKPIEIQRGLGLRRRLPRALHFLAPVMAWLVGLGVQGDAETAEEANGCFLIQARKRQVVP